MAFKIKNVAYVNTQKLIAVKPEHLKNLNMMSRLSIFYSTTRKLNMSQKRTLKRRACTKTCFGVITGLLLSQVQAEVITDGTVGAAVPLPGPNYAISHDLGTQQGANLYHSFDKFNIKMDESANFTGPVQINNVFGRVTGGEKSSIDGQINSNMPNADIYLVNPRGILFGPNASLNVPGSFYASTADKIILKDGIEYNATNPQTAPLLSAEPFSSFGFLDDSQASVSVNGSFLEVSEGKTLGLVGGEVSITESAELLSGGEIEIESKGRTVLGDINVSNSRMAVRSGGEGRIFFRGGKLTVDNSNIRLDSTSAESQIEIDVTGMDLTKNSNINLSSAGKTDDTNNSKVVIGINNLDVLEVNNSSITTKRSDELDKARTGDVLITAKNRVKLSGKSDDEPATINVETSGEGDAGNIDIETPVLEMEGAIIHGQTSGSGKGSNIRIVADKVTLTNSQISIPTTGQEVNSGNAGNLTINPYTFPYADTGKLTLTNSSIEGKTEGTGNGASVQISAKDIELSEKSSIGVGTNSTGDAGTLKIDTDNNLTMTQSTIAAGVTSEGTGKGDEITIKVKNNLNMSNSEIFAGALGHSGDAGTLDIDVGNLLSLKSSQIMTATSGSGKGGPTKITAKNIELLGIGDGGKTSGSLIFSSTISQEKNGGEGGDLFIQTDYLKLDKSSITASTYGTGRSGSVRIIGKSTDKTDKIEMSGEFSGNTGAYSIVPFEIPETILEEAGLEDVVKVPLFAISVDARGQAEDSGSASQVFIDTKILDISKNAAISGFTLGTGRGGSLDIYADRIKVDQSSIVAATSGPGEGRSINLIVKESINLSGTSQNFFNQFEFSTVDTSARPLDKFKNNGGDGGNLTIAGPKPKQGEPEILPKLTIENGASISSATSGPGKGGDIQINVEQVKLDDAFIFANAQGSGDAGNIRIEAVNFISNANSEIITNAVTSQGGDVTIITPNLIVDNGSVNANVETGDKGGNITADVTTLTLKNGGEITSNSEGAGQGGNITITASDYVNILGPAGGISAESNMGKSGNITVNAGNLLRIGDRSEISTESKKGEGGTIDIDTPELLIENGVINAKIIAGQKNAPPANIDINVDRLTLTKGRIESSTEGQSPAGNISITATEYIKIFGRGSGIRSESGKEASGSAGSITIGRPQFIESGHVPILSIEGGEISTKVLGSGDSGSIKLFVDNLQVSQNALITAASEGIGNKHKDAKPANIDITVKTLALNGEIETSTEGQSPAGNITITATDYINIFGRGSGIRSESGKEASGSAGSISIGTPQSIEPGHVPILSVGEGGDISTRVLGNGDSGSIKLFVDNLQVSKNALITAASEGVGKQDAAAANLDITTKILTVNGKIKTSTEGNTPAGNIAITATDYINIVGTGSGIFSESAGTANAGTITIGQSAEQRVPMLILNDGGELSTKSSHLGDSGTIKLFANDLQVNKGSSITATSEGLGRANAIPANIAITAETVTLQGDIKTSTQGYSPAGEITMTASKGIHIAGGQILSQSSSSGRAGEIRIDGGTMADQQPQRVPTLTLTEGSEISTTAKGRGDSGSIELFVDDLNITDGEITSASEIGRLDAKQANIDINVRKLTLGKEITTQSTKRQMGLIGSSTQGQSPAGNITITATEYVKIIGEESRISSDGSATGHAGEINIKRPLDEYGPAPMFVSMKEGGKISTTAFGKGDSGTINLLTDNLQVYQGSSITATSEGEGNANAKPANIEITTQTLTLDGTIETSTKGQSHAGKITILATNNIDMMKEGKILSTASQIGKAGEITIHGGGTTVLPRKIPTMTLTDGSEISTTASGTSDSGTIKLFVDDLNVAEGTITSISETGRFQDKEAKRGNIELAVKTLTLGNKDNNTIGRIETTSTGQNPAGNITITASKYIDIFGKDSGIFSEGEATGPAGTITIGKEPLSNKIIPVPTLTLEEGGQISTTTKGTGDGGTILLFADNLQVNQGTSITAASEGEGNENTKPDHVGNIGIITQTLILDGKIETSTQGKSPAGKITITASKGIQMDGGEILSTASQTGNAGEIIINGDTMADQQPKRVPTMTLTEGSKISTTASSKSNSGTIALFADDLNVTGGSSITSINKDGTPQEKETKKSKIHLDVNTLTLGDKKSHTTGHIASSTEGTSPAGLITIKASQYVEIFNNSSILSTSGEQNTSATGAAGRIVIAKNFTWEDYNVLLGEKVKKLTLQGGEISTTALGTGDSGKIDIAANDLKITQGGSISAASEGTGSTTAKAANIVLDVQTLTLNNAEIETSTKGESPAGNIAITGTKDLEMTNSSIIKSSTEGAGDAGNITITATHYIKIFGEGSGIFSEGEAIGRAGTIIIGKEPSGKITPVPILTLNTGGQISTSAKGTGDGGTILLFADDLQVNQGTSIAAASEGIGKDSAERANIDVTVQTLTLNGKIKTSTEGKSPAGNITITATEHLKITDGSIESSTKGAGHAGEIIITASEYINIVARDSSIFDEVGIFSKSIEDSKGTTGGNAGSITIQPHENSQLALTLNKGKISTTTEGAGKGGTIDVKVNNLVTDGGIIESSTEGKNTEGKNRAGNITITASEYINLDNSRILSTTIHTGNAGQIEILVGEKVDENTNSVIAKYITERATEKSVKVYVPPVNKEKRLTLINNSEISTTTSGKGDGGNINITTDWFELKNNKKREQADISAESKGGSGIAGNITIGTNLLDMSYSKIETSSTDAKGGNILIGVREIKGRRISHSEISASAGEEGNGGNLEILGNPDYLILDSTDLTAEARKGHGGNININANVLITSSDSAISASSDTGIDGSVNIDSAQIDVESISLLPRRSVDASELIKDCVALGSEEQWSIVLEGKVITRKSDSNRSGCVK